MQIAWTTNEDKIAGQKQMMTRLCSELSMDTTQFEGLYGHWTSPSGDGGAVGAPFASGIIGDLQVRADNKRFLANKGLPVDATQRRQFNYQIDRCNELDVASLAGQARAAIASLGLTIDWCQFELVYRNLRDALDSIEEGNSSNGNTLGAPTTEATADTPAPTSAISFT